MHVLVLDGEQRAALAAVRSLAAAGYRVTVASTSGRSLAGASRHAVQDVAVPFVTDPHRYAESIAALVRRSAIDVVLPITDPSLLAVLPSRALIPALIPFPEVGTVRAVGDKERVMAAARRVGVRVPRQWSVPRRGAALPPDLSFPVVLKPHRSVVQLPTGPRQLRVAYAADGAQLTSQLGGLPDAAFPVLLQERVVGPGTGVFLLRWGGRTVASFAHRRIREKPPSGGVSVYRESIPLDPALLAQTEQLLDHFAWEGVAMVEYKVAAGTGIPYIMEINGRLWGSLQLAIDAGVDFPVLLVEAALGRPTPAPPPYRVGVRSRWFWGDVDQLLTRLRRSRARLAAPPDLPGRLRGVRDFLAACLHPGEEEVFRWSDPWPFLRETAGWLRPT